MESTSKIPYESNKKNVLDYGHSLDPTSGMWQVAAN